MSIRCSVFIAVSADGFIARNDGGIDWLESVQLPGEDYGYAAFFSSVDTLVMGRKTYDTACGFETWPYTGKRVVVLTHRPGPSRHGEHFVDGEVKTVLGQLSAMGVQHAYVDGGAVVQQFLAAGAIDSLTLSVVPVLLGSGIPLFRSGAAEQGLELVGSQSWSSGLVQLRYRVRRPQVR